MTIIAGLGNPGRQYEGTRHNSGFASLDRLAGKYGIDVRNARFHGLIGLGAIEGQKVLLVKPQTYMNESGVCLREAVDYYRADPASDLIVLYDDISLVPGQLRIRTKGSAGGHNGIKSVISCLGTDVFRRIKIGVGAKPEGWDLADWVLGRFPADVWPAMDRAYDRAAEAAAALLTQPLDRVLNEYNTHLSAL